MEAIKIKKATLINAGNYLISIGTHKETDVAIISKKTGDVVAFENIKKRGRLQKIKRKYKIYLCCDRMFYFSFMQPETTIELINFLKK